MNLCRPTILTYIAIQIFALVVLICHIIDATYVNDALSATIDQLTSRPEAAVEGEDILKRLSIVS